MKEQKWVIGIIVALIAMGGIFFSLSKKVEPKIIEEIKFTPFGQFLKDEGVKFYGASWCPHCQTQKKTLGDGTWEAVYVECAVEGRRSAAKVCEDAKIESFPTWIFKDGTRKVGAISTEEVKELSGYIESTTTPSAP